MFKLWHKAYHASTHFVKRRPLTTLVSRMHNGKGVGFAIIAAFLYSSIGVSVKFASITMSSEMMVWCRQTVALLLFLPIFFFDPQRSERPLLRSSRPSLQLLRSVSSLATAYCLFYALAHLPLTNAILLSYTRPLFLPILVWVLLKKRIEKSIWIGLTFGFIGILLVIHPEDPHLELAAWVGLAAGLLGAFATLCIRWLAKTQPPNQITFYYFLISALLSSIPLLWLWEAPSPEIAGWLLLIGLLSTLYQMCITRAYRYGRVTVISSVLYTVLIFTTFYEWAIWNKIPDLITWLGILLICGSSLFTITMTQKKSRS